MVDKSKFVFGAGVLLAAFLAIASMAVTASAIKRLNDNVELVSRSDDVLRRISNVLSLLQDAETGQRGFLITGRQEYLQPYESALPSLETELVKLRSLVADNPVQEQRMGAVERGTAVKLAELVETIEARRAGGFEPSSLIVLSGRGKAEMDRLREMLGKMNVDEVRSRDVRELEAQNAYRHGLQAGTAAAVLALIAVSSLGVVWRRYRRAMESRLHQSESQLRITLASIGDAVISADAASNITYLNQVAAQLTGWTCEEAVGMPLSEVFQIRDELTDNQTEDPASRAIREGQVVVLPDSTVMVSKEGRRIPIDDSTAPLRSASGLINGAVVIFRDVTEKRERIRELERSERLFRSLADCMPQLCWMAHPDGHVFWYNRGWYAYTGKTVAETEGWGWQSAHDPKLLPEVMERWQRTIADGVPFDMILPLRGADGHFRQFLTRVLPVMDEAGAVTRWFGTSTDVTAVKEAEEVLAQRERELQTLADNTPDILTRFDRQLGLVFVNAAAQRFTGRSVSQLLGKTNRELGLPVELCDVLDAAIQMAFESGKVVSREFSFDPGQGPRHFRALLIPEQGPSGDNDHVLSVTHDRTAEKEAQDALLVADRRKDEFLATLAHELRNPLAPLRTGLQVLRLTNDPAIAHRTRLIMERQLAQMVHLIDDLLEISRITSGKIILRLERVELQNVIDTAVEAVRPQIDAAGQVLKMDILPEHLWLEADPTRICQIVSNLLANASKYSPHGSAIRLSSHLEVGEVVIAVSDSGAGIPNDMLAQVFEMFAQVDRTLDRAQGGLGIGLALVKRLVEMHGGTVLAESVGLGAGSTFTVRLPAVVCPEGVNSNVALLLEDASEQILRVLVVDDNGDAANSLAELLSVLGHQAKVAGSGASALTLLNAFQPSLVFLDIDMPGMDGYESARRIRIQAGVDTMTLVALTGWGADTDKLKAKDAGFDFHFTKPIGPERLDSILEIVRARRSRAESAALQ